MLAPHTTIPRFRLSRNPTAAPGCAMCMGWVGGACAACSRRWTYGETLGGGPDGSSGGIADDGLVNVTGADEARGELAGTGGGARLPRYLWSMYATMGVSGGVLEGGTAVLTLPGHDGEGVGGGSGKVSVVGMRKKSSRDSASQGMETKRGT